MTVELREFIEARLAEDEAIALAVQQRAPWLVVGSYGDEGVKEDGYGWVATGAYNAGMDADDAAHIARHDPARVLRDVEAKRRLLAQYQAVCDEIRAPKSAEHRMNARARQFALDEVLVTLALPYADHPNYDPSWSPEAAA
jgi:hypothetical protein